MMRALPSILIACALAAPGAAQAQFSLEGEAPARDEDFEWFPEYPDPPPTVARPPAVFPPRAEASAITARCTVIYSVDEDGAPTDVCTACAVGPYVPSHIASLAVDDFLDYAAQAVSRWRFQPGQTGLRYGTVIEYRFPDWPEESMPEPPPPDSCKGALIS